MAHVAQTSSIFENSHPPHSTNEMEVDEGAQQLIPLENDEVLEGISSKQTAKSVPCTSYRDGDKISRRLSGYEDIESDTPESSPTKRPRITSLFGGPSKQPDDNEEILLQKPSTRLGVRMPSLDLDQQETAQPSQPTINLATILGLTEFDSNIQRQSPALPHESGSPESGSPESDGPESDGPESDGPESDGPESDDPESGSHEHNFPSVLVDPVKSYGLRNNIDRLGAVTTHIDIDRSGNYDPTEEARRKSLKMNLAKRAKKAQRAKTENDNAKKGKRKGKTPSRSLDDIVFKRIVRLPIRAMGSVLNITDGKDNWPDYHSVIDTDDEVERQQLVDCYRRTSPDHLHAPQIPIPDPAGEVNDLTGYPEARGCKECRLQKTECSMTKDGQYPCAACKETVECNPIIKLPWTRPCERCEITGQPCSFENSHDNIFRYGGICDECLDVDNERCEARQSRSYRSERVDLDQELYSKDRKWVACTHCREDKKKCSLKKASDKPPCRSCKKQKIGCHFYDVTEHENMELVDRKGKNRDEKEADDDKPTETDHDFMKEIAPEFSIPNADFFSSEDLAYVNRGSSVGEHSFDENLEEPEEQEMMEDAEGHRGYLTNIKTSFAHPMVFSIALSGHTDAPTDCNFCEIPTFGMVGFFEREVSVMEWNTGLGYTEFGNGHREHSSGPTTMCETCTLRRLQVITCENHVLQRTELGGFLDFERAAENLLNAPGKTPEMQNELQRWCSMCFSLATHMCCNPQSDINTDENDEDHLLIDGCGLRMCDDCAQKLSHDYNFSLHEMATAFDSKPKAKENDEDDDDDEEACGKEEVGTVRADVGLLKADGLLARFVQSMGE